MKSKAERQAFLKTFKPRAVQILEAVGRSGPAIDPERFRRDLTAARNEQAEPSGDDPAITLTGAKTLAARQSG